MRSLIRNYQNKINLGEGKFAYEQTPESYSGGLAIIEQILEKWKPPKNYFHYQKGDHLAALTPHKRNTHFTKLDLSQFFYKVTKNKVLRKLVKIGFKTVREHLSFRDVLIHYKIEEHGRGDQIKIICPFHNDHKPSCGVNHEK